MEYEIINSVIHAGRSLTVEYGLNSKATIYACASNAEMIELLRSQTPAILHLIKAASHFHILSRDDPIPSGCVVYHVSEEVNILLLVKVNDLICFFLIYIYICYLCHHCVYCQVWIQK